jgi:xylulokinase
LDSRFMNTRYTDSNRFFCMSPVNGAGHSMKWMKKIVMDPGLAGTFEDPYFKMNECAKDSVIGSNGILFHPYLSGERSPIWNPYARGSFFGLTADHKAGDMIRSVLEGVGYALLHNLDIMREMDIAIDCFRAGGGGAASSLWLQILADILNTPIQVSSNLDSETQGAAVLAGVGAGFFSDISAGNRLFFRKVWEYEPDANAHRTYRKYAELFQLFYERNADLYRKLSDIRNKN